MGRWVRSWVSGGALPRKPRHLQFTPIALMAGMCIASTAGPAASDFEAGFKAFEAGRYAEAMDGWRPLADDGDARAQYHLGLVFLEGLGTTRDTFRAEAWLKKAAQSGHSAA